MKRMLYILLTLLLSTGISSYAQSDQADFYNARGNLKNLRTKSRGDMVFQRKTQPVEGVLKRSAKTILFQTDFSDGIDGWVVYGEGQENWYTDDWGMAGGDGQELTFDYEPEFTGESYMASPVINTTGYNTLIFEYTYFIWYYGSSPVTIGVYTTIDNGENWLTVWEQEVSEDTGPELQTLVIDNEHVGSENFRFAFGFSGNNYQIMGYFIDDVVLSAASGHDLAVVDITPILVEAEKAISPSVTLQNFSGNAEDVWSVTLTNGSDYTSTVENITTIQPGERIDIPMDEWIPLQGKYLFTATVNLSNDENEENNTYSAPVFATSPKEAFVWAIYVDEPNPEGVTGLGPINLSLPAVSMEQIAQNSMDDIYAAEYIGGILYGFLLGEPFELVTISPEIGTITPIGGGIANARGLAHDITTGITYAMDKDGVLYTIDLSNGEAQIIGGGYAGIQSLTCDNEGILYAISIQTNDLVSIDKTTGLATPIGLLGFSIYYKQEIAYDRDNEILYGILSTEVADRLFIINKDTGYATLIESLGVEAGGFAIPYTSQGTSVENVSSNLTVKAYPNPTHGLITLDVDEEFEVSVLDITGRILKKARINSSNNMVDLSPYGSGLYILKLTGSTSHTITVVKQ